MVAKNQRYQRTGIKILKSMLDVFLTKTNFRSYESIMLFDLEKIFFKNLLKQNQKNLNYYCKEV